MLNNNILFFTFYNSLKNEWDHYMLHSSDTNSLNKLNITQDFIYLCTNKIIYNTFNSDDKIYNARKLVELLVKDTFKDNLSLLNEYKIIHSYYGRCNNIIVQLYMNKKNMNCIKSIYRIGEELKPRMS